MENVPIEGSNRILCKGIMDLGIIFDMRMEYPEVGDILGAREWNWVVISAKFEEFEEVDRGSFVLELEELTFELDERISEAKEGVRQHEEADSPRDQPCAPNDDTDKPKEEVNAEHLADGSRLH